MSSAAPCELEKQRKCPLRKVLPAESRIPLPCPAAPPVRTKQSSPSPFPRWGKRGKEFTQDPPLVSPGAQAALLQRTHSFCYLDVSQHHLPTLPYHAFYFNKNNICIILKITPWEENLLMELCCIPKTAPSFCKLAMRIWAISLVCRIRSARPTSPKGSPQRLLRLQGDFCLCVYGCINQSFL